MIIMSRNSCANQASYLHCKLYYGNNDNDNLYHYSYYTNIHLKEKKKLLQINISKYTMHSLGKQPYVYCNTPKFLLGLKCNVRKFKDNIGNISIIEGSK